MKISVCCDLHFKGKKIQDKIQAWEKAVDKMIAAKVGMAVIAGDVFDSRQIGGRESSTGTVYRAFMGPMLRLKESGIEVFGISGNHDLATAIQLSALETMKDVGVTVVDGFGVVKDLPDAIIAYIPWVLENGTRAEDLKRWLLFIKKAFELKPNKMKIVIGHITVRGAQLNSGITLQGSEFEVDAAQLDDLGADLICLGHIHKRQHMGKNIWYVGALSQEDFGEEGNPDGFMVIDTKDKFYEFIELDDVSVPRYMTLSDGDGWKERNPSEVDYIKFRFKEKPKNYDAMISSPRVTVEIVPEREVLTRKVAGVEAGKTADELLDAYLKGKGAGEEDRVRIISKANELAEGIK